LFYNAEGNVVTCAGGVGVVYDVKEKKQRFFRGHDNDIVCLAVSKDGKKCATGQQGKDPPCMVSKA
jgi:microtubule-associated protein-like 6